MKNRKAEIMARFEERLFFPGFFQGLKGLFGRDVSVALNRFTAFWFLLIATRWGRRATNVNEFIGMAPALEYGSLVRWIVRNGLATEGNGRLRLCDNERVRERRRFVTEAMQTFKANLRRELRRECPELWKTLMSASSPRLTTEGLPPRKLARLLAVGGSKGYRPHSRSKDKRKAAGGKRK